MSTSTGAGAVTGQTALPVASAPRRAFRPGEGQMVGGVAAGLAHHLGLDVFWVRLGFVVATWFSGFGVLVYAALWRLLPQRTEDEVPAGVGAATRRGLRTQPSRLPGGDVGQAVALLTLGVGVILLLQRVGWGLDGRILWPVLIAVAGFALVWRQADEAQRARWRGAAPGVPVLGVLTAGGVGSVVRLGLGVALVAASIGLFVAQVSGFSVLGDVAGATALALLGLALLVGPWVHRLSRDLAAERRARVRSQERADMAAHLHDSVLQTLAMLQRHADDPRAVARLARRQERELRLWLYDEQVAGESLCRALTTAAAETEDMHDVAVEVICVGDAEVDDATTALARAAGEAMVNAARHSGAAKVDVYAEVSAASAEVFVRDRGVGFDPDALPAGRMGVRQSIIGRMERHGGSAQIRSSPGAGTEVHLSLARGDAS